MNKGYEHYSTDEFSSEAKRLAGTIQRWDEIYWSFDFGLTRNPKKGFQVGNTDIWLLELRVDEKRTMLYYRIDDEAKTVTLIDLMQFDVWVVNPSG